MGCSRKLAIVCALAPVRRRASDSRRPVDASRAMYAPHTLRHTTAMQFRCVDVRLLS